MRSCHCLVRLELLRRTPPAVSAGQPARRPGGPVAKARRRSASSRHSGVGCRCAPRPGSRAPSGPGRPRGQLPDRRRRRATARAWRLASGTPRQVRTGLDRTMPLTHAGRRSMRAGNELPSVSLTRRSPAPNSVSRRRRAARPASARRSAAPSRDRRRLVGADVDAPAGQPGGEAGVLPLLADRERQLVVRHDHAGRPGLEVDDLHAADPGRARGRGPPARPGRRTSRRCRSSRRAARA